MPRFRTPGSTVPVPGNGNAADRFQREACLLGNLPVPVSKREAATGILFIRCNISVPLGAALQGFGPYKTECRTAARLTDRKYRFERTNSPDMTRTNLSAMNLEAGQPARMLDPDNIELSSPDIGSFRAAPAPF